jgi:hypothetical protein
MLCSQNNIIYSKQKSNRELTSEGFKPSEILLKSKKFISNHLRPYILHFERGSERLTFKAVKRGSVEYFNLRIKPAFRKIRREVSRFLQIQKRKNLQGLSNGLLLTYTFECGVWESWQKSKNFSSLFKKVKERLRYRGLSVVYGVKVFEAQRSGKAHIHLLLILSKPIEFRFDGSKKRGYIKSQKVYLGLRQIFDLKLGFFDLQPITSKNEAVSYLTKYIAKNSEGVELLIEENDLSESEIKRIVGLYFLLLFRLRQFSVFGSGRRLDKSISNNLQKAGGWQRLKGGKLIEWLNFLRGLGLIGGGGLVVGVVRLGSDGVLKIIL